MFKLLLLFLNFNYYKKFGKNLYFIYGGNDSKLYNIKKSLKEKLYKIGEVSSGIFYYKDSFQNMISIYFRITGVLLFIFIIFIFLILPNLILVNGGFFSNVDDLYIYTNNNVKIKLILEYFFYFQNSKFEFLSIKNYFFLYIFKYIISFIFFCFIFHVLKKLYMFLKYDFFNKLKSGYEHFLVKNKKI